jgi:LmbE family N-acetylglucosaminyl deacetylase
MLGLPLGSVRKILCLGAHSDDIEIGAGGTILRALQDDPMLEVTWVVFSSSDEREVEARASAARFLEGAAKSEVIVERFRENFFPYDAHAVKGFMGELSRSHAPDLVLTHQPDDLHQDHRFLAEITLNAFRDHLILGYEIPKWDGDMGRPNVYSALPDGLAEKKLDILMSCFSTQAGRDWFTRDLFSALMRLRGMECRSPSNLAEAFYNRKLLLGSFGESAS